MINGKILITGGAGYIGSHVVRHLINEGISPSDIVIFDNLERGNIEMIQKEVIFEKGDLQNKDDIKKIFLLNKISYVIHFAAYAYVGESMVFPEKYFENNVCGGLNLLNAMIENNVKKIVFSSSCAIYGNPKVLPIMENNDKIPINPYGLSKLMFEEILKWYDKIHGMKSICLRYFNVAGAGDGIGEKHEPETHVIPLLIQASISENEFKIFGDDYKTPDGSCIRDYVHVSDLADAHYKALNYLISKNESNQFNIGNGNGVSIFTLIKKVEEITRKKVKFVLQQRREGDPPILTSNSTKANEILNWKATKDINDIIKDAYLWESKKI